jgi:hypothetical protein
MILKRKIIVWFYKDREPYRSHRLRRKFLIFERKLIKVIPKVVNGLTIFRDSIDAFSYALTQITKDKNEQN